MRELLALIGLVAAFAGLRLLSGLGWIRLYHTGLVLTAVSFVAGVALMGLYHWSLRRFLARHGIDDPQWYRHALRYNHQLKQAGDQRTLWLCYAAAFGFFAIVVGIVFVCYGMFLGYYAISADLPVQ